MRNRGLPCVEFTVFFKHKKLYFKDVTNFLLYIILFYMHQNLGDNCATDTQSSANYSWWTVINTVKKFKYPDNFITFFLILITDFPGFWHFYRFLLGLRTDIVCTVILSLKEPTIDQCLRHISEHIWLISYTIQTSINLFFIRCKKKNHKNRHFLPKLKTYYLRNADSVFQNWSWFHLMNVGAKKGSYFGPMIFSSNFLVHPLR